MKKKVITLPMPEELLARIDRHAAATGASRSHTLRQASEAGIRVLEVRRLAEGSTLA
jgi:metal-responsive CopG/Arc/MetJ family transcriptional regulator